MRLFRFCKLSLFLMIIINLFILNTQVFSQVLQKTTTNNVILSDINKDAYMGSEIYYFVKNRYISPYKKNRFKPNYILNKSQFITLIISFLPTEESEFKGYFSDVVEKNWAAKYIESAVNKGVIEVPIHNRFYPKALQNEKEAYDVINKLFTIDTTFYTASKNVEEGIVAYSEYNFLTREKVVEYLANTERFKEPIAKFKAGFKFPVDESSDPSVKNKFLDDAISKYLANDKNPDELIADMQSIKKQGNKEELIDEKLSQILKMIYEWKYYDAIKLANEILQIDSKNVQALMRRGSAYYLLEQYDRARQDWNLVLKYDQDNALVHEFLQKEGKKEDQTFIIRRIELEKKLEGRVQDILRKRLNIQEALVLMDINIGAEMVSPLKEKSLLPGIPAQSSNLYEKYFIKDVKIHINVDNSTASQKVKLIPATIRKYFNFPVILNKNLYINKTDLTDKEYVGVAEKFYISGRMEEVTKLWEQKLRQNRAIIEKRLADNKKFITEAQEATKKDVAKIYSESVGKYTDALAENFENQQASMKKFNINHIVSTGNSVLLASMLVLLYFLFKRFLPSLSNNVERMAESGSSEGGSAAAGGGGAAGAAGAGVGDISVGGSVTGDDDDEAKEMSVRKSTAVVGFFDFIDDSNIFKLKHLLKSEYDNELINIEQLSIVCSYLPSSMSNIIISEFEHRQQAEIVAYLVYSNQYELEDIAPLDKKIKNKLSCLVGGKEVVLSLLNHINDQEKTELTKVLAEFYPDVLEDIRDMIVLFEDLLVLDEQSLKHIFSVMDPYIVAAAIIHLEQIDKENILSVLTEGMRDMVNQVMELKDKSITKIEILNAQEHVVKVAKSLSKKGIVTLIKKSFGNEGAKESQTDIDALIAAAMGGDAPTSEISDDDSGAGIMISDDMDSEKAIGDIDREIPDESEDEEKIA